MKQLLFSLLVLASLQCFSQSTNLALNLPRVTSPGGKDINPSSLHVNQSVDFIVPVLNMGQKVPVGANSVTIVIDLGNGVIADPEANIQSSALPDYFTWSTSGNSLVGTLKTAIPADFMGNATFRLKCVKPGVNTITMHLVYASEKLRPATAHTTTTFMFKIF